MSNSNLAEKFIQATHYSKGRSGRAIQMIAIHHMAGVLTAEQCGNIFKGNRQASAHYGIGNDGRIAQYVDEADTAWTNSNWDSNCKSVTIETSNSEVGGNWAVSDSALNSLIKLVADIAKRNNIVLEKGKTVVWHSMYVATTCPGPYLLSKIDYIIEEANKINNSQITDTVRNSMEQYIVKAGDTLSAIAQKYGTTVDNLIALNSAKYQKIAESRGDHIETDWVLNIIGINNVVTAETIKYKVNADSGLWLLDANGKKIKAYVKGTEVEHIGEGYTKYGYNYAKVKVSDGNVGYMAKKYLV